MRYGTKSEVMHPDEVVIVGDSLTSDIRGWEKMQES